MEEAISWGISIIVMVILWLVLRSRPNRRTSTRTRPDVDGVRDSVERTADNNRGLTEAEQRTAERLDEQATTIERAADNNQRAQQLVGRARQILADAKYTDSSD